jgi:hypothetical protein
VRILSLIVCIIYNRIRQVKDNLVFKCVDYTSVESTGLSVINRGTHLSLVMKSNNKDPKQNFACKKDCHGEFRMVYFIIRCQNLRSVVITPMRYFSLKC